MPILHIRALPQKDSSRIQRAMRQTCLTIAKLYKCDPEEVWTTWEEVKPGLYLEGETPEDKQPAFSHPPICELICFKGKTTAEIELLLAEATKTLSLELGVGDNIFMIYREVDSGQAATGNGLVRKS